MEKSAEDIVKEIKQVDNNVNGLIVPILKDTIEDYRRMASRLIVIIVLLVIGIIGLSGYSVYKYNEFITQFEYETDEYVYQDTDGNSAINDGIDIVR